MILSETLATFGWPCLALSVARSARTAPARRTVGLRDGERATRDDANDPLVLIGRAVRAIGSRALPLGMAAKLARVDSRRVGLAMLVSVGGLLVAPTQTPALIVVWWLLARRRARRTLTRQRQAVSRAIPEVIDLVRLALDGGCTIPLAFTAVGGRYSGALGADLRLVARDIDEGRGTASALEGLLARVGEPARPLCSALLAGERYGLPTAAMLDALAIEARATRRHQDEQRARRLPITMLFPLITCTLPAFALLTVVPLLASGLQAVRW